MSPPPQLAVQHAPQLTGEPLVGSDLHRPSDARTWYDAQESFDWTAATVVWRNFKHDTGSRVSQAAFGRELKRAVRRDDGLECWKHFSDCEKYRKLSPDDALAELEADEMPPPPLKRKRCPY